MTKFADGFLCESFNRSIVGDVSRLGNSTAAGCTNFGGNAFNLIGTSSRADNCRASLGQSLGNTFADPATGSRHHRHLSVKSFAHDKP